MKRGTNSTCTTCDRSLPSATFPKLPPGSSCTHGRETCRRCWHQWLAVQIETKQPDEITCAQCPNLLSQAAIRTLATPAAYSRYLDVGVKAALSTDKDFRWCISPDCKSGQVHLGGAIFTCNDCGAAACVNCNTAFHVGETCEAFQARKGSEGLKRIEEEKKSEARVKKKSKLCPGCSSKVEKNGGCDHMTCTICHHEFCWLCLANYREVRARGNNGHKQWCKHFLPGPPNRLNTFGSLIMGHAE